MSVAVNPGPHADAAAAVAPRARRRHPRHLFRSSFQHTALREALTADTLLYFEYFHFGLYVLITPLRSVAEWTTFLEQMQAGWGGRREPPAATP